MKERWLINISNHSSEKWEPEQKHGWNKIIDIPFPKIDPTWDASSPDFLISLINIEGQIIDILSKARNEVEVFIMLQGEFSFCYILFYKIKNDFNLPFAIPTTDRVVNEVKQPDGSITKQAQFKFVKWRFIE